MDRRCSDPERDVADRAQRPAPTQSRREADGCRIRSRHKRRSANQLIRRPKHPSDPRNSRLVELRAYAIWVGHGRPTGRRVNRSRRRTGTRPKRQILDEVKARAFKIWEKQGRPTGRPATPSGKRTCEPPKLELLKETEEELLRHPTRLASSGSFRQRPTRQWNTRSEGVHGS